MTIEVFGAEKAQAHAAHEVFVIDDEQTRAAGRERRTAGRFGQRQDRIAGLPRRAEIGGRVHERQQRAHHRLWRGQPLLELMGHHPADDAFQGGGHIRALGA